MLLEEMLSMRYIVYMLMMLCPFAAGAQVAEQSIIDFALQNFPSVRMANAEMESSRAREKTAFNPEQPTLTVEFPAENTFGFEAEQRFKFPTVYTKRSQWLKSLTGVAEGSLHLTQRSLMRDIRMRYLEAQYWQDISNYFAQQDSLWMDLVIQTNRLYEGGSITKADQLQVQKQSGLISLQRMQAKMELLQALSRLTVYYHEPISEVYPLTQLSIPEIASQEFYFQSFYDKMIEANRFERSVVNAERFPDLLIGYVRETELDTEFGYRYKAGVSIPLWQSQYSGEAQALEAKQVQLEAERDNRILEWKLDYDQYLQFTQYAAEAIAHYERVALPQSEELIGIYQRLFEAGEVDYPAALRSMTEALTIREQYLELVRQYNVAVIELNFLTEADQSDK